MTVARTPHRTAWFRRLMPLRSPRLRQARPAADRTDALARFEALSAADGGIPEATRSRLFEPTDPARATLVIWHGFTNAPSQFTAVAEHLCAAGYRVLLPRMPFHGESNVLNHHLAELTDAQLAEQAGECVDIAAGFKDPVWVAGLSAGAILAGWAAATRLEVSRLVLAAPLVAPIGFPQPLVRLFVRFPRIVPPIYWWWDPRVRERIQGSQYAYPGFPLGGIVPFLRLSEWLFDGSVRVAHDLDRVVLVTNPSDFAIRKDTAAAFTSTVYAGHSAYLGEAHVDAGLKWRHDFVDPRSPGTGSTAQVVALLLAAFGTEEASAGGVLVPPLVTQQPA